jgi:hypothetical protein
MDPEIDGRSLLSGRHTRQVRGYISSKSLSSISVPERIMTVIVMCVPRRGTGADSGIHYLSSLPYGVQSPARDHVRSRRVPHRVSIINTLMHLGQCYLHVTLGNVPVLGKHLNFDAVGVDPQVC